MDWIKQLQLETTHKRRLCSIRILLSVWSFCCFFLVLCLENTIHLVCLVSNHIKNLVQWLKSMTGIPRRFCGLFCLWAKKDRWEMPPGVAVFSNNPMLLRETENFSIRTSCGWIFFNVRLAVDPIRTQPELQRKSANLSYVKWSRTARESAISELENLNHISNQA